MATIGPSLMDVPTICFGFTLGFMTLTASKAAKQTFSIYRRKGNIFSLYLAMIWAEIVVNFAMSILTWLALRGDIKPRLWYLITILSLWVLQTQFLLQIIANRVALVMTSRRDAFRLKLFLFFAVAFINISVYCIWIPARLNIGPMWVKVNHVWDRIEKVIYLILDAGLNVYFLWLVRSKLITRGLRKYEELWRFNAGIVGVSIAMDILIIGMMSLPNDMIYTQFHSLAYIVKLNIELCMADLISKVVRKQERTDRPHEYNSSSNPSKGTELTATKPRAVHGSTIQISSKIRSKSTEPSGDRKRTGDAEEGGVSSESSSESGINFVVPEHGIVKTVAVETVVDEPTSGKERDVETGSTSSSTARLRGEYDYMPRGYRM